MKTIAVAAVFFALTATAWADEPQTETKANSATGNEPIVLSEAEMDAVTAGDRVFFNYHHFHNSVIDIASASGSGGDGVVQHLIGYSFDVKPETK